MTLDRLPVSEADLIAAARAGDRRATDRLLRDHQARIYAVCRRVTGNDADALDATQDAMIAVVRGLPSFDGRSRFSTWVYRIATNSCLDELRRRKRRPFVGLPEESDRHQAEASVGDPGRAVDDRLLVEAGLRQLPEDFRVAVVLRDLCQLDYAEIAEVLDVPAGTVRSRISRGRSLLATHLSGNRIAPTERPTTAP
ncbi:MAG: sigma-70 family RNA polymerase sigma factor [Aquihabitans sp.]